MVKLNGRYVLRIERPSYPRARADAAIALKTLEWGAMIVTPAAALLKDSKTRSGVRKAIRRVPYIRMPKPSAKPNTGAALREVNALLASRVRLPKAARLSLFRVTQLLCPAT
jgi:hypothetical protein